MMSGDVMGNRLRRCLQSHSTTQTMNSSVRLLFISMFALVPMLALSGCSTSTTDTPPVMTMSTPPGVGSMFVMDHYDLDSAYRKIDSTEFFDTVFVAQTGMSYEGKTNVMQMHSTRGNIFYINEEPNSDISTF